MAPARGKALGIGARAGAEAGEDAAGDAWSTQESTATASYASCSTPASPASTARPSGCFSLKWRCGARFASGSYGCVYRAFNLQTGQIFATKVNKMKEADAGNPALKKRISDRLAELEEMRHENILEHLGHDFVGLNLYVYMEHVEGSLSSRLEEFGPLRPSLQVLAVCGLLEGLHYLHTRSPPMVHGAISSSTILVNESGCLKLQCFQCSRHVGPEPECVTLDSIQWVAPEVFQGRGPAGTEADMWSAGCVVIEMATAERPWGDAPLQEILDGLRGGLPSGPALPEELSPAAHACAAACLRLRAAERPSAGKLLAEELPAAAAAAETRGHR